MTALVRDLLDLTRLETPGGRLAMRGVDSGQLVSDVSRAHAAAGRTPAA